MSDAPETPDTTASQTHETPSHDLPDLDAVQAKIDEAHAAEDHLVQVSPGAIDPEPEEDTPVQTEGGAKDTDETGDTDRS